MKKLMSWGTLVALVSIVAWGCGGGPERPAAPMDLTKSSSEGDHEHGEHGDHDHDHEHEHEHEHEDGESTETTDE